MDAAEGVCDEIRVCVGKGVSVNANVGVEVGMKPIASMMKVKPMQAIHKPINTPNAMTMIFLFVLFIG